MQALDIIESFERTSFSKREEIVWTCSRVESCHAKIKSPQVVFANERQEQQDGLLLEKATWEEQRQMMKATCDVEKQRRQVPNQIPCLSERDKGSEPLQDLQEQLRAATLQIETLQSAGLPQPEAGGFELEFGIYMDLSSI